MESSLNGAKRKKRKTRKCLDEIRKRSRRTGNIILFENDDIRLDENYNQGLEKCMITNNRLTLRMFPRAIQSKTITRPVLLDLEQKQDLNLDELVKGAIVLDTQNSKAVRISINDTENTEALFQTRSPNSDDSAAFRNSTIDENGKQVNDKNSEAFSSMDEMSNKSPHSIGTLSVEIDRSLITSSSSTQSVQEGNGYSLYEEFMSEVPACLQQNSRLIQEDVMKKTKMLLQNLFIESCYSECEGNVLKCINNNGPKVSMYHTSCQVVHKPMDYIRLNHIQNQGQYSVSVSGSGHSDSGSQPSASCASGTPPSVVVVDTPDYMYYPHRLN